MDRIDVRLEALVGPLVAPLEDLSYGAWRAHRFACEAEWPAADVALERPKLLARTTTGEWLVRFAGLGDAGEHALARARILHAAGFTPKPAGLCHGFLVEQWHHDAQVLDPSAYDRTYLLARVGDYLAFRARAFPAPAHTTLEEITAMTREEICRVLGADAAREVPDPPENAWQRSIAIDGRLHAHEWLVTPDGALLKTDALDHHTRDAIGCRDASWDVAGAAIELGLPIDRLAYRVGAHPAMVVHAWVAYVAYQLGRCTRAIDSASPAETARLQREAERYARLAHAFLYRR